MKPMNNKIWSFFKRWFLKIYGQEPDKNDPKVAELYTAFHEGWEVCYDYRYNDIL